MTRARDPRFVTTALGRLPSGGARFAELATWPQHERDLAAETIYRFVFRSLYEVRAFNGDLFAVLGELSATADWRAIAEEIWPFVQGPASTPMGEAEAAWRAQRQAIAA